ncbi:hypothetical protein SDRG_17001 [Saprolegnia diclina VS20]|uniref:Uncharacterized protein n=1 Tax=Saprolegnia diclina (strain VS20) TaxID=1156394 RepID=T0PS95_SAPDV|nr:hypothetical protein SDRG_17001 [Saprolegnia diclina VS20]EQC25106.1 hypothetical protein SDRG_17001 [Saprolegnia diclina VS20]|eukprot:XP_008621456.1 hypothetical protein SDRG_17001 [Saprolegnia diclina VS20]
MAKRVQLAPASVVDAPRALVCIVQCFALQSDVAAFLNALPRTSRSPPLAALLQLIVGGARVWPHSALGWAIDDAMIPLVKAAMPLFPSLHIESLSYSDAWRSASATSSFAIPFCAFLAEWASKVEHLELCATGGDDDEGHRLLYLCTNVRSLVLSDDASVLPRLLASPFRITRLELRLDGADWPDALLPWLASGHAMHVGIRALDSSATHTDTLALALATAPSLTSLVLTECDSLLCSFVARATPLQHVTHLAIKSSLDQGYMDRLLSLVNASKLEVLDLSGAVAGDLHCSLAALQSLTALDELSLCHVTLHVPSIATASSTLREARFESCSFVNGAFGQLVDWLARSEALEAVDWTNCMTIAQQLGAFGRALRRWIRGGTHTVAIEACALGDDAMSTLAMALSFVDAPDHFTLELVSVSFGFHGWKRLLEAAATSTNVSVTSDMDDDQLKLYRQQLKTIALQKGVALCMEESAQSLDSRTMRMLSLSALLAVAMAGAMGSERGVDVSDDGVVFDSTLSAIEIFQKEHPAIAAAHDEMQRMMLEEFEAAEKSMRDIDARFRPVQRAQAPEQPKCEDENDHECVAPPTKPAPARHGDRQHDHAPRQHQRQEQPPQHNREPHREHRQRRQAYRQAPSYDDDNDEDIYDEAPPRRSRGQRRRVVYEDDEDDYDVPQRRVRSRYPSQAEMDELIKQQVRAQLMEAREAHAHVPWDHDDSSNVATKPTVCLTYPLQGVCDWNILAGLLWTALVVVVVVAVSRHRPSPPRATTASSKKTKTN